MGLPECARFATKPVSRSLLIIPVSLTKLTSKPPPFNNLNKLSQLGGDLVCKEVQFVHVFACNWKLLAHLPLGVSTGMIVSAIIDTRKSMHGVWVTKTWHMSSSGLCGAKKRPKNNIIV